MIACVASVSARVRRESWEESKKKGMTFFFNRFRSNFRAITRLETLATQARGMKVKWLKNTHDSLIKRNLMALRVRKWRAAIPYYREALYVFPL